MYSIMETDHCGADSQMSQNLHTDTESQRYFSWNVSYVFFWKWKNEGKVREGPIKKKMIEIREKKNGEVVIYVLHKCFFLFFMFSMCSTIWWKMQQCLVHYNDLKRWIKFTNTLTFGYLEVSYWFCIFHVMKLSYKDFFCFILFYFFTALFWTSDSLTKIFFEYQSFGANFRVSLSDHVEQSDVILLNEPFFYWADEINTLIWGPSKHWALFL